MGENGSRWQDGVLVNNIIVGLGVAAFVGAYIWFEIQMNQKNSERHKLMMEQMQWAFDIQRTEYMKHQNGLE